MIDTARRKAMQVLGATGVFLIAGTNTARGAPNNTATIDFHNQDASDDGSSSVTIQKAYLPEGGAVAVHDPGAHHHGEGHDHSHHGTPGPIVGWSDDDLRPGTHVDLAVEFDTTPVNGPLLVAMTHEGVGAPPYTRNGDPVVDTAFVRNLP